MNPYTIALFVHVTGAIGYFVSAGIRLFNVLALRRAQRVEQVRLIAALDGWLGPVFGISVLLLLIAGLYMAGTSWGFQTEWIDVALITLILMAPVATALMEPRRRAIARLAQDMPDGPIPAALAHRIHDPILHTSAYTLLALLLGIVFLMTTKPALLGSIIAMLVALVLGVAFGLLRARAAHPQEPSLTTGADHASAQAG